ncbi:aminopeptidase O isoform X2 [Brachyhypopomus gauderio]|uniref:aminopeptidase O isoform X2 n=1 Tax=Brachyhypopomus gauderio TaxID=698409 RepID=UPI00404123FC
MESNPPDLDPNKDDLPLRANTNHMLVRHYVLDLTVSFTRKVIGGSIVLFLEPGGGACALEEQPSVNSSHPADGDDGSGAEARCFTAALHASDDVSHGGAHETILDEKSRRDGGNMLWADESEDFTLILDCCDLMVSKVEELDVSHVPELWEVLEGDDVPLASRLPSSCALVQRLISVPSSRWRQQQDVCLQCSRACAASQVEPLLFNMDQWSLQIRKKGVRSPHAFPSILRIWYETKPTGGSVRWTTDQDGSCCVYTAGSPINNRALFPCQEPPVAMSTWWASVKAPCEYVALLSGENQAVPWPGETGFLQWNYYVTMPMPASTFTVAVGRWQEAAASACVPEKARNEDSFTALDPSSVDFPGSRSTEPSREAQSRHPGSVVSAGEGDQRCCSHVDYPCRFTCAGSRAQVVLPHRVFAPSCHLHRVETTLLPLLPLCLTAAHAVLGVHPFSRLDVLLVPPGFSSLGMASPHIIFLSQSVLAGESGLRGQRLCHEIAHSWFGLAIGARDWTEEWISEGFATYLEDVLWARVQQLGGTEEERRDLKALLRWRRLRDEVVNSQEDLQVLSRGLTIEGIYSDWLDTPGIPKWLEEASSTWSQIPPVLEVTQEVAKWKQVCGGVRKGTKRKRAGPQVNFKELHAEQLLLLMELLLDEAELSGNCLRLLQTTYNLRSQDAEVKHRWCELVVKHKHTAAYRDVEHFLLHDQAMGVYLYGELMLQEDGRQQALARRCLAAIKDNMDQSARSVVEEMIL